MSRLLYIFFIVAGAGAENLLAQTTSDCSDFGSSIENVIYYVNGVDNETGDMLTARNVLQQTVGNNRVNRFDIAENRSDGVGKDFYQAYKNRVAAVDPKQFWLDYQTQNPNGPTGIFQNELADAIYSAAIVEYARDSDLREMIDDFVRDLNSGKKVVLVAHSQGNFYANAAYTFISQNWPSFRDSIGIVAVASPAPTVADGGFLTQNAEDSIIFDVVSSRYFVQSANVNFKGNDIFFTDHGFLTTYMLPQNARSRIVGHINATISRLKTPLSRCDEDVAVVQTLTARDVTAASATIRGQLTQGKNASAWFIINKNASGVSCTIGESGASTVNAPSAISESVSGLTPNTLYSYRACAKGVKGGTSDGGLKQFATIRNSAKVGTPYSSDIGRTTLDMSTKVLAGFGIDVWFVLSKVTSSPTQPLVSCDGRSFDGIGVYSQGDIASSSFSNLQAGTRYMIRACGKGSDGTTYSSSIIYRTTTTIPEVPCSNQAFQGSSNGLSVIFNFGTKKGTATVNFQAFAIPDGFRIFKHNTNEVLLQTPGLVGGSNSGIFSVRNDFNKVDVVVIGNSDSNTLWEMTMQCP